MFRRKPPRFVGGDIRHELLSICRSGQMQRLPRPLKRDMGIDCGCDRGWMPPLPGRSI